MIQIVQKLWKLLAFLLSYLLYLLLSFLSFLLFSLPKYFLLSLLIIHTINFLEGGLCRLVYLDFLYLNSDRIIILVARTFGVRYLAILNRDEVVEFFFDIYVHLYCNVYILLWSFLFIFSLFNFFLFAHFWYWLDIYQYIFSTFIF